MNPQQRRVTANDTPDPIRAPVRPTCATPTTRPPAAPPMARFAARDAIAAAAAPSHETIGVTTEIGHARTRGSDPVRRRHQQAVEDRQEQAALA